MSIELTQPGCELLSGQPMVIKNVKNYFHIHTYGGLSPFFVGLREGRLLGTRCGNASCEEQRIFLPPRTHCPDCLSPSVWVEAPTVGEIYTLSLIHISEPTRLGMISYAVFCLKKKK